MNDTEQLSEAYRKRLAATQQHARRWWQENRASFLDRIHDELLRKRAEQTSPTGVTAANRRPLIRIKWFRSTLTLGATIVLVVGLAVAWLMHSQHNVLGTAQTRAALTYAVAVTIVPEKLSKMLPQVGREFSEPVVLDVVNQKSRWQLENGMVLSGSFSNLPPRSGGAHSYFLAIKGTNGTGDRVEVEAILPAMDEVATVRNVVEGIAWERVQLEFWVNRQFGPGAKQAEEHASVGVALIKRRPAP